MNISLKKNPQQIEQEQKLNKEINKLYDEQESFKDKFNPREHIFKRLAAVELIKFVNVNKTVALVNTFALIMVYAMASMFRSMAMIVTVLFLAGNVWFIYSAENKRKFYKDKYNL